MTERTVSINGEPWTVSIAGRASQYDRDEITVIFERKDAQGRKLRLASRFSPQGARHRQQALAELSEAELLVLHAQSQPEWTSPELGYAR